MTTLEKINKMLNEAKTKMFEATTKEELYQAYRDARTWVRLEYMWAEDISAALRLYCIAELKAYKREALKKFYVEVK